MRRNMSSGSNKGEHSPLVWKILPRREEKDARLRSTCVHRNLGMVRGKMGYQFLESMGLL